MTTSTRWRQRASGPRAFAAALLAALAAVLLAPGPPAAAQTRALDGLPSPGEIQQSTDTVLALFEGWEVEARRAEEALASAGATTATFEVLRESLAGDRAAARALADRIAAALAPLRRELEALRADGPGAADGTLTGDSAPPPGLVEDIEALQERIQPLAGAQRRAERAYARADVLIDEIDDLIRERQATELLQQGPLPLFPSAWAAAGREYFDLAERVWNELVYNATRPRAEGDRLAAFGALLAALAASAALAFVVRGKLIRAAAAWAGESPSRARGVLAASGAAVAGLVAPSLALALLFTAVDRSELVGPAGRAIGPGLLAGLVFAIVARGVTTAYFSPAHRRLRVARLDDDQARAGARGILLVIAGVVGWGAFVEGGVVAGLSLQATGVAAAIWATLTALGAWRLSRAAMPREETPAGLDEEAGAAPAEAGEEEALRLGRRVAATGLLGLRCFAAIGALAVWLGYVELGDRLIIAPVLTLGLALLAILLFQLISDGVEAYIEGREAGVAGGEGLRLIPLLVVFLLGCAALPLVALIWGARPSDIAEAWRLVVQGVNLGGVRLSPIDALTFVVVFGVGYSVTRLLQTVLGTSVLPKTRIDAGGRSALVSGLGYVGFAVAGLIAVSAAGLNLSSLAIVAGALSVGIGFGLQTIVNNFVSGLILLVERPVKVGDWIEVGGTHGTVRRISVRATQIETFDRSALILPNSELISGRVVNYTHGNDLGRVIVRVGVAYGTDVRRVETILREIAAAESRALRYPPAQVLFMGFGADSLDFEVRMILRDIGNILAVTSDTNFAIERRFREEGIEIPFAQRVLHIQNVGELGEALRGGGGGRADATPDEPRPPSPKMPGETDPE